MLYTFTGGSLKGVRFCRLNEVLIFSIIRWNVKSLDSYYRFWTNNRVVTVDVSKQD